MANQTLCNNCRKEVKYISTRMRGTLKCEPTTVTGVQKSGRVTEVYLLHDCNRIHSETSSEKNGERKLWLGPDPH